MLTFSTGLKGLRNENLFNFCDVDCQEVIKYICTRWLCTERCVDRELKKYPSLRSYFQSENERDQRFVRLHETFSDPVTEVCMHFYQSVLPTLTNFNKFLQTDEPLIQCLYDQIQSFMNKLASKFIKPEVIQQLKQKGSSFTKWNISLENQKSGPDLTAGILTKALLAKLLDDGDILENSSDCFCDGVRAFYKTAYEYCGKWLPTDDTLHKNCRFLDFFKRNTISFDCLTEILALFPNSFDSYINDTRKLDELEEEYLIYQSMEESEIPKDIWDAAAVPSDEAKKIVYHRMDMIWAHLRPNLPQVTNITFFLQRFPIGILQRKEYFL